MPQPVPFEQAHCRVAPGQQDQDGQKVGEHLQQERGDVRAPRLQLQLQAVTEIDATGIQLLLATQAALRALGRPFQLDGCSAPVNDALDLLGLRDTLAPGASDTFH